VFETIFSSKFSSNNWKDVIIDRSSDLGDGIRGTYDFLSNKISLGDDDPAVELHEKVHADNIEALLEGSEEVREKAVSVEDLPESYTEALDELGVAEADYSLASGITFQRFEEEYGFDISEKGFMVKSLFSSAAEDIMEEVVTEYSLDFFDVRDEAFAQTVEAHETGWLESPEFSRKVEEIKRSYNNLKGYREDAGEMIAEEMRNLRNAYKVSDLDSLLEIRPDYLRGDL